MLVLTRKLMEKLHIGDQITVTVVRLETGQVRLGIDAPRQIPVVRGELRPRAAGADSGAETGAGVEADDPASPPGESPPGAIRRRRPVPLGIGIRRHGPSR